MKIKKKVVSKVGQLVATMVDMKAAKKVGKLVGLMDKQMVEK
jgi:hypothetical protein